MNTPAFTCVAPVVGLSEHQADSSLIVYGNASGVFAVDLVHDEDGVKRRLASVGTGGHPGAVVIPLLLVIKAGDLARALHRLSECPDLNLDTLERESELALYEAQCALSGLHMIEGGKL